MTKQLITLTVITLSSFHCTIKNNVLDNLTLHWFKHGQESNSSKNCKQEKNCF